ncbi:MAG: energy transducer TonB [Candidatus Tectomicrobia bacterium]|nr:energy transducer TonB [Candidatus Tectomicrobia bacterium]
MRRARIRLYVFLFLSLLIHAHLPLLWNFLPASESPPVPVAVRYVDVPPAAESQAVQPSPDKSEPEPIPEKRPEPAPAPPRQGGLVVDLPEPVQQERPDDARIVSRYDSQAQDIGPGDGGTRKPSAPDPPDLPPELNLPERLSVQGATRPRDLPAPSQPPAPATNVARLVPPVAIRPDLPRPQEPAEPVSPQPGRLVVKPVLQDPRYQMTLEEELDMLRRRHEAQGMSEQEAQKAVGEHLAMLDTHRRLPGFDAPGVYDAGPVQTGEGEETRGDGGRFRSIGSFGLEHVSYLLDMQRKIELMFSVPFLVPDRPVGVPIVGFTVQRNGELSESILLRSSGYEEIDRALLKAVRRAAPYRPFPDHLADPSISIRVFARAS